MTHDDGRAPQGSPAARRVTVRRLVWAFIVLDVIIVLAVLAMWLWVREDASRANVFNEGLRGSLPPAGQELPSLDHVDIEPKLGGFARSDGRATMLVTTCLDCQSGDVIGGFLGRLAEDDIPAEAAVIVLGWDGDIQQWAQRWHVDGSRFQLHAAADDVAAGQVRELLHVRDSGITFLAAPDGTWRSTFHVGQLDRADIRHDLEQLSDQ